MGKKGFPSMFQKVNIEINSKCNRSCWFCPVAKEAGDRNENKLLDTDVVKDVIRQLKNMKWSGPIGFDFFNEPTLDERLFEFAGFCRDKGFKTVLVTNGDRMRKDPVYAKEILKAFTKEIYISLYDYTDKAGLDKLRGVWKDFISGLNTKSRADISIGKNGYWDFGNRTGKLDRKGKLKDKAERDSRVPLKMNCRKAFNKMSITYEGDVPICCYDFWNRYNMGNVKEKSIKEIWTGKRRMNAIAKLNKGDRKGLEPCYLCPEGRK